MVFQKVSCGFQFLSSAFPLKSLDSCSGPLSSTSFPTVPRRRPFPRYDEQHRERGGLKATPLVSGATRSILFLNNPEPLEINGGNGEDWADLSQSLCEGLLSTTEKHEKLGGLRNLPLKTRSSVAVADFFVSEVQGTTVNGAGGL